MNLTFYGDITLPKRTNANLATELIENMNACTLPYWFKTGTPAWSLNRNVISLLETVYSNDDITLALDLLQKFLKEQKLTARGNIEYYGDYYGSYSFKRSCEYVEVDKNPQGWS